MKKLIKVLVVVALVHPAVLSSSSTDYVYPLKHPAGRRYLADQNERPFLWIGDAAWSLLVQLSTEEAVRYLDDRKEKGFTVLLVNLIEHKFGSWAPANRYGEPPFTGKPFITPNEGYFAHADTVIQAAAKRGLAVLLCPLYLGYACGDDGFCAETRAAEAADLREWGRYVGERYASFDNIVWCIGGDTDPTPVKDRVLELVNGIREKDKRHLFTAHNHPESQAVSPWPSESWLTINNVYTYDLSLYLQCKAAYERSPLLPFFMMESAYENEHQASQVRLRSQAYWPLLCGAMGQIYGNCPMWHFGGYPQWCGRADWQTELDSPGAMSISRLARVLSGRPWHLLIPDFNHQVMTDGYGSWGKPDYAAAACAEDGSLFMAYLPVGRTVTVDMKKLAGEKSACFWYNPRSGEFGEILLVANHGSHVFSAPSQEDWLLVIEGNAQHTPVPYGDSSTEKPNGAAAQIEIYPNPGNRFTFVVSAAEPTTMTVYDLLGRAVCRIAENRHASGVRLVYWDAADGRGNRVLPGLYFVILKTASFSATKKLLIL